MIGPLLQVDGTQEPAKFIHYPGLRTSPAYGHNAVALGRLDVLLNRHDISKSM